MTEEKRLGSELDLLMSLDPLEMTDQQIDAIILYERQQRIQFEMGVKPKKDQAVTFNMTDLIAKLAPAATTTGQIKRRV